MSAVMEVLEPCEGCNAGVNEPCRESCLSYVTDSEGQPLELDGE